MSRDGYAGLEVAFLFVAAVVLIAFEILTYPFRLVYRLIHK